MRSLRRSLPWAWALLWLGAVVAWGLLLFTYRYLEGVAAGEPQPFLDPLICEMTGGVAAGLLFFPVRSLVRRRPLARSAWAQRLPLYAAALLVFAAVHTSLMWGQRALLFPLAGLGRYDYGAMPVRYLMELPVQAIGFAVLVAALHAVQLVRAARERELKAAQLETSLAQAQLRSLRLQLQPHFLFNALNTISATMYADPAAADEMLDQLAELLRASLKTAQHDVVPLDVELAILDRYLAILRARFGERLAVATRVEPGAERALVPTLLLQPLVENAVRHGGAERRGTGAVEVRARREGGRLVVEVEDDGVGPDASPPAAEGSGVGLTATAERLRLLYGEDHAFTAGRPPGGGAGFVVRIAIPFREAPGAAAP